MPPPATPERDYRADWSAFRVAAQPSVDALRRSHCDPQAAQRARLATILSAAQDTAFGRAHDFSSIDRYETYAERVPPADWPDMQSWIDRACREDGPVLSAERPLFFEPTSGSSSACKLIPYTPALLQEFQRAIVVWLATLYDDCPTIATGRSYWALSPPLPSPAPTANGTAVGGARDAAYLAGSCAMPLLNGVLNPKASAEEPALWRVQTVAAMINAPDLKMISVWSPTFLLALLQPLAASGAAVDALRQHLDDPQCAMLDRALSRGDFSEFWPDLQVVSCWMDGPSERFVPRLQECFSQASLSPKGLLATEGVVSIPLGQSGHCPLALDSHFLEFVTADGRCVLADALIAGEPYQPLLTTSGGLYRYALGDVIRYAGTYDGLHCVRFVGRADTRCDLAGEKLDESLVSMAFDALGEPVANAVLVPRIAHGVAGYALLIDSVDDVAADSLARRMEERLLLVHHYAQARSLGQLAELEAHVVNDVAGLLQAAWRSMTRRMGDLKPARLVASLPFAHAIMGLVARTGNS